MTIHHQPKPKRRWVLTVIVSAVTLLVGIGIGSASSGQPEVVTQTIDAGQQQQDQLDALAAELDSRKAKLDAREKDIAGAEQTQAANTVGNGIWTVGVDIEAGTYRASDVGADCYWAVLATGSNGNDIIANDIPGGGNPTVTLRKGHDFETSRCGEWTKR